MAKPVRDDPRADLILIPPGGLHEGIYNRGVDGRWRISPEDSQAAVPLWLWWFQVAQQHTQSASGERPSDDYLDDIARGGDPRQVHLRLPDAPTHNTEAREAMVAVTAAAHSIDGFYGSAVHLIDLPTFGQGTAQHRKIMEALKRGFKIGNKVATWPDQLEWLFGTRNGLLHHAESLKPMAHLRETPRTVIFGPAEMVGLSAEAAARAVAFTLEVLTTCLQSPKPRLRQWAEERADALSQLRDA